MSFATKTEKGKRQTNEDSILTCVNSFGIMIAVADGMGGHSAGAQASSMAIATLAKSVEKNAYNNPNDFLIDIFCDANTNIYAESVSNSACSGMGTTLVCAIVSEGGFYAANVGDSRLYLYRKGSVYLQPITRDHSYVQELVRCGLITAEEAKVHPNRNLITRAVGTSEILDVDTFSGDLYDGDVLLLCSDGLHGVLSDEELYSGITKFDDLDELCEYLVKLALKKGSKDNITVAVYRYDGEDCQ